MLVLGLTLTVKSFATPATDLLDKLKKTYPNIPFSHVVETPVTGIYEAGFGKDILYVEASGTYFFPTMVNMITKQNLGEDRRAELNKVNFSDLPLKDAIKVVNGDGSREMVVFSDPNCSYCKRLEQVLSNTKDTTVYVFAVGILGEDSVKKANAISCADGDKGKLWRSMVLEGKTIPAKSCDNSPVTRNLALFQTLGFQGTPGIVFKNGTVVKGFIDAPKIEELLAKK
ncbi:putative disulfide bond isomerase DsbC [Rhodoferax antarcticus ANT.BR]|uniref:Thiol:disulfide interchange protein n=2 Tax=Rhodoferax antarcticus TaxID=81479 RepID=A0A1Q8Y948_9BURK|nr:putative disulfide bond isomerase DsbC [Rhodoferax antarcticus ANT.BR]